MNCRNSTTLLRLIELIINYILALWQDFFLRYWPSVTWHASIYAQFWWVLSFKSVLKTCYLGTWCQMLPRSLKKMQKICKYWVQIPNNWNTHKDISICIFLKNVNIERIRNGAFGACSLRGLSAVGSLRSPLLLALAPHPHTLSSTIKNSKITLFQFFGLRWPRRSPPSPPYVAFSKNGLEWPQFAPIWWTSVKCSFLENGLEWPQFAPTWWKSVKCNFF